MCVPHCFTVCLVGACKKTLPDRWPEQPASPPTPSPSPPPPDRHRCPHRGLAGLVAASAAAAPSLSPHRRGRRRCLQGRAAAEKAKEALAPALRTIGQDGFTDLGNILASAVVRGFMHAGRRRVGRASPAGRRGLRGRALPPAAASLCRRPCPAPAPPAPLLYLLPPQAPLAPYVL